MANVDKTEKTWPFDLIQEAVGEIIFQNERIRKWFEKGSRLYSASGKNKSGLYLVSYNVIRASLARLSSQAQSMGKKLLPFKPDMGDPPPAKCSCEGCFEKAIQAGWPFKRIQLALQVISTQNQLANAWFTKNFGTLFKSKTVLKRDFQAFYCIVETALEDIQKEISVLKKDQFQYKLGYYELPSDDSDGG